MNKELNNQLTATSRDYPTVNEREGGIMEKKTYIKLFESPEDSYQVDDYPWGFRLRTSRRSWVESKKGHGMRICHQTINPKTGAWCKPKKSTYSVVMGLYKDENGHLQTWSLSSGGWTKEEEIKKFEEAYGEHLTKFQKEQIRYIRATNVMNEVISYEIKPSEQISLTKLMNGDPEEKAKADRIEANQQTQEEKVKIMNKALAYGFAKVDGRV